VVSGSQALAHNEDVVHCRDDGEGKGRAQKRKASDGNPSRFIYFQQQHKEDGRYLRESVRFAKDAGAKVAQSGDGVEHGAGEQDGNVTAKNQDSKFPRDLVQDRKHWKHRAEQEFIGDGIKVLSQHRLLPKSARQQAIESVAESSQHKQNQCR